MLALAATVMLAALAISCARPGKAEAFSFFCPFRATCAPGRFLGGCGKQTAKDETFTLLGLNIRNPKLLPSGRGKEPPLDLVLQTNCISPTGILRPPDRKVLKINFKPNGNVDYKHSDLNGDGKFDRGQLK